MYRRLALSLVAVAFHAKNSAWAHSRNRPGTRVYGRSSL